MRPGDREFGPEPSWWQHPGHLRKCKLAKANVLDRIYAKAEARQRREALARAAAAALAITSLALLTGLMAAAAFGSVR